MFGCSVDWWIGAMMGVSGFDIHLLSASVYTFLLLFNRDLFGVYTSTTSHDNAPLWLPNIYDIYDRLNVIMRQWPISNVIGIRGWLLVLTKSLKRYY